MLPEMVQSLARGGCGFDGAMIYLTFEKDLSHLTEIRGVANVTHADRL